VGNITGTVTALNGNVVPGAVVVVEGVVPKDHRTTVANENGYFEIDGLAPGTPFHLTISAQGFTDWTSAEITLSAGQFLIVKDCKLNLAEVKTTVVVGVASTPVELATEEFTVEEHQRVFGIVPNYYVVYDKNAPPLTTKRKFKLALRTSVDPVTFIGVGVVAGIDQGTDRPNYVQGAKGFGQRLGATYADGVSDILIGGAILPALLHQDPRYFYQGTGSVRSRLFHAISSTVVCRGDNGKKQPNFSTVGGDLMSSALNMAYYPDSDRSASTVFTNFLIDTGERMTANLAQEFILRKLTKVKGRKPSAPMNTQLEP
jgi:hypothetical protein